MNRLDFELGEQIDTEMYGPVRIVDITYTVDLKGAEVSMEVDGGTVESLTVPDEAGAYQITIIDESGVDYTIGAATLQEFVIDED